MATKLKQSLGAFGIIAGLSALLVVLGVLQFRWSNQIRTAELERKQAALEAGMNGFREDFRRELAGICTNFTYRPPDQAPAIEDLYRPGLRGLGAIFRPPGTGGQLLSLGKGKGGKLFVPPIQSPGRHFSGNGLSGALGSSLRRFQSHRHANLAGRRFRT